MFCHHCFWIIIFALFNCRYIQLNKFYSEITVIIFFSSFQPDAKYLRRGGGGNQKFSGKIFFFFRKCFFYLKKKKCIYKIIYSEFNNFIPTKLFLLEMVWVTVSMYANINLQFCMLWNCRAWRLCILCWSDGKKIKARQ